MIAAAACAALLLTGCGGGGGSTPTSGTLTTVGGSAGDGPVTGAAVSVVDANGALVVTTPTNPVTDATAHFSFTVPTNTATPLIITVSGGIDTVTGAAQDFPLTTATTSLPANGAVTGNANPLSTLAVATAAALSGGAPTAASLAVATSNVLSAVGFGFPSGLNPISTVVDTTNVAAILKANEAAAELIRRTSVATTDTPTNTIANLANDLTTGALDGQVVAGITASPQAASIAAVALAKQAAISVETLTNNLTVTTPSGVAIPSASGANFTTALNASLLITQPGTIGAAADTSMVAPSQSLITQASTAVNVSNVLTGGATPSLATLQSTLNSLSAGVMLTLAQVTSLSSNLTNASAAIVTAVNNAIAGNNVVVALADTVAPVVTAPAAVTIEATGATTAVALGAATVTDAVTAGLTATASPVGPYAVGVHTIVWSATDVAGNVGTATQTVTVTDTVAPVVTAPVAVKIEATGATTAVALGAATVTDAVTAGLTATASPVGPYAVGVHTITWTSVADGSGLIGTATQTVTVTDTTAPVITVAAAPATIEAGLTYIDAGATAADLAAGNVAVITAGAVDTGVAGTYSITYTATDGVNTSTATRLVTVTDTTLPVVTAPAAITVEATGLNSMVALGVATVTDNAAAVLTATPSQTSFPVGGPVTVTWTATDAAGNVGTATQLVTVTDTTLPVITLNNPNLTVLLNGTFTDPGAIAADIVDGNVTITGVGAVTTSTLGNYPVVYNYTDVAGNIANTIIRTVAVVLTPDTTLPVITLLGAPTVNVTVGGSYVDAGVTALDNRDGNITLQVNTVNIVNMNVAATYTITYNVSDAAGNAATQVTRTVIVAPLVGGALADNQINTGNLTGANTTYANMLTANAADVEAAIGVSMTAMAGVIDNASFRALAAKFTFDSGVSLPTGAAAAAEFNAVTPPANPILVNWARNSADLLLTAVNANALQDPGLDPVLAELTAAITRLEALKAAGFVSQVVQGKNWDVADVDGLLGILYGQRGLVRWARAYNWNTQTSNVNVPDMFSMKYTDVGTGNVYRYQPINSSPVAVLNDPSFFTLNGNGVTLLSGAHADFLAAARMSVAFDTAMLNTAGRGSDGTHPFLAEVINTAGQQLVPQFDAFGNFIGSFPVVTPTTYLTSAQLNQKIIDAQHIITALDTAGLGLNVGVTWANGVPATGVVQAHKALVGAPLTRGILNTYEYRDSSTNAVVTPNASLSKKYNQPIVSEIAAPTTPAGWATFIQPAGSRYWMLPNGTMMLVVTAYIDVVGSTNVNPLSPVNDPTLGGVLSTGIGLDVKDANPAPANVFPAPKIAVTYP